MTEQAKGVMRHLDVLVTRAEQERDFQRGATVQALSQMQEVASAASKFARSDTYRVVLSRPTGGALHARADGLLDAFVKGKDGQIVAVARLQKVGPSLISSVTALAGHAMLVQISGQIERLQGTVEQVLAKLDTARLGKIDAALAFLTHADHYRPEHRTPMLLNAVQKLSDVLGEALRDVQQGIAAVPEPQEWNLSRAIWDTTEDTAVALDRVASSMRAILLCLRALGQAQTLLNTEEGAANIMRDWLEKARSLPLDRAEYLARRLPIVHEEERRDRFWIDARQVIERALERVEEMLDQDRPLVVQFEAKGAQFVDILEQHSTDTPNAMAAPASATLRADPGMRPRR